MPSISLLNDVLSLTELHTECAPVAYLFFKVISKIIFNMVVQTKKVSIKKETF